jgi:predicted secreted protein with PEFG-CTERM motif
MRTLYTAIALFTILAPSVGLPVFAQEFEAITVATDQEAYEDGDTIIITGTVRERLSGYPVSLQVIASNGNIVTINQLDVSEDNTYGVEVTSGGGLWRSAGTYTIKVLYGTEARTAETTFEFGGSVGGGQSGSGKSIPVEGTDFLINYMIKGGKVISVTPSIEDKSLIIVIETTGDGELTATLPRALIDARMGADGKSGEDDSFFVLVDGAEVDFDETTTSEDRTLTIAFEDGASEIEIIGTFAVPEFGTMAAIILAVAIVSIIAVSAKSRLVLTKY